MTIQQMEYITAVNKYRHFVTAAKHCGVAQPTLSAMIHKLEEELGTKIFDRTKQPIEPTALGKRIIEQAEIALKETRKIQEMVEHESGTLKGPLKIGIIPTLAPYLVPDLIKQARENYPELELIVEEKTTAALIEELNKSAVDVVIAATPLNHPEFLEIPLYYERFVAYFSDINDASNHKLSADRMPMNNLWILQEGHCMRSQTFNFCKNYSNYNRTYEAGSIDTLIRIVERNGGYSVIPELHLQFLNEEQRRHIGVIDEPPAIREISMVIRKDFVKERVLNAIADIVKKIIPEEMLDTRLKKFSIKL